MITWLLFLALVAYVALDATAQGKLTWVTREWVPMSAQDKVSVSLHWLYPACYAVLALVAAGLTHRWAWLLVALLLRLALFDPLLQWARGDKLFSLGSSSYLDRQLARAPWMSMAVRLAALVGSVAAVLLLL